MVKDIGDIAVKLSRNPLGVLSLAFVFVYGIAGYVCTSSSLQGDERRILIWFIVLFPIFILFTFYRLVTKHNTKLFGPADFTDESLFLAYSSGQISHEQAERNQRKSHQRSAIEFKILNTLWTKQVNFRPDYSKLWTFRINYGAPEFNEFRVASNKLIGEGLVAETDQGQLYLTPNGYQYCKDHYQKFPPEQWWPEEILKSENLKKAIGDS